MTIKEIAALGNVSARTAHRVAAELYPTKHVNGQKTTYSREEAIAIMAKLRKPGFITPEPELDKMASSPRQNGKLPNGAQMRELRLTLGPVEAGKVYKHILGYPPLRLYSPEEPRATPAQAQIGFTALEAVGQGVSSAVARKAERAASLVAAKVIESEANKAEADLKQGRLGL